MMKWFGKNYVWLSLAVILALAIFLRTYHFDEWLYFKMDQSRDALLIKNAVDNGPQDLPLLGARVGAVKLQHGFLRLGPIYYYFQYLSGVLFHSTEPYVFAYPDLLFSILAIPLVFFLVRLYFPARSALLVTAMYAFSFLIIQYSRFAWNPNSLQFFLLLAFYGLLRFLNEADSRRRKRWLVMWSVGMAIGSQLHFFGFFTLLGVSGLLVLFHFGMWKKENIVDCFRKDILRKIAGAAGVVVLVFAVFYAPVVLSDIRKSGQNSKNFIEALSAKPVKKPLSEKLVKAVTENARYYCLLTTSQCYEGSLGKEVPTLLATGVLMLTGFVLTLRGLLRKKLSPVRRDFLALLLLWTGVFFVLTIPVSFQLRPRFFIVVFAIPFIFSGLLFEYLEEKWRTKQAIAFALLFTAGLIAWNTHGTLAWFKEQTKSQTSSFIVKRTLILKAKDGVTLGELEGVTDFMYARHATGNTLYYYIKPEHIRPIEFLLTEKNDAALRFTTMTMNGDPHAEFFAVTPTKSGLDPVTKKFGPDVTVTESKKFGQITVYALTFPTRAISDTFKPKKSGGGDDRVYWKDVFK